MCCASTPGGSACASWSRCSTSPSPPCPITSRSCARPAWSAQSARDCGPTTTSSPARCASSQRGWVEPGRRRSLSMSIPTDQRELRDIIRDKYAAAAIVATGENASEAACCRAEGAVVTEEQREYFGSSLYGSGGGGRAAGGAGVG